MKTRQRLVVSIVTALLIYFTAYFLSVGVSYQPQKVVDIAVPVYRPWDAEGIAQWIVQKLFAPAQLLDATYLRPAKWQDKRRGQQT